ncbi:MAG: hypothetical protein EA341_13645 [Mongoliibacter sp.]|uniref:DUF6508 domain-containing protein n=1 Tax=Mongoliibacter sp. TaxID=2022438 RepID=UPI0012F1D1F1|nr:DUF6508 domain-containing protein [Mongoliibacter sp.]TVP46474.1 MAG: hypothetical protein EA341_13645 [Mongoliibacter sp.]
MKIFFTPIDEIEDFLASEEGENKLSELKEYYIRLDSIFQKLYDLPVKLTPEAMRTYLDFGHLDKELHSFLLTSGLLPVYDWENWLEGKEIIDGMKNSPSLNQVKAFKLLSLVVKLDIGEKGIYDNFLESGQMLWLLEFLIVQNSKAPVKPESA